MRHSTDVGRLIVSCPDQHGIIAALSMNYGTTQKITTDEHASNDSEAAAS